jgi:agmatine deiminase
MVPTPKDAGFCQPGEWVSHSACWVAFPSDQALWPDLEGAQQAFVAMCRGISAPAANVLGEPLEVLVQHQAAAVVAQRLLSGLRARFHVVPFGDIWMRDIAPVFLQDASGFVASVRFHFNGWGQKYEYSGDDQTAEAVQHLSGLPSYVSELVCEGGAVESDGAGLCMTTRDVALNPNRNPGVLPRDVTDALQAALGAERVIWLERGLLNDHTDGHIDNIARFVAPKRVVCMRASGADDPNRRVLAEIEAALKRERLEVVTLPSPGLVLGRDGQPLPASYLNFYIANRSVVVPTFDTAYDDEALAALFDIFPGREVIGVPAKVFLQEGGTIHCITQQQPAVRSSR